MTGNFSEKLSFRGNLSLFKCLKYFINSLSIQVSFFEGVNQQIRVKTLSNYILSEFFIGCFVVYYTYNYLTLLTIE